MAVVTPELVSQEELRWDAAVHTPQIASIDQLRSHLPPPPLPTLTQAVELCAVPRPASPGTVEKMAALLRSISFAAALPPVGDGGDGSDGDGCGGGLNGGKLMAVATALAMELRGKEFERLAACAPELAWPLHAALLVSCAALLGGSNADGALVWAADQLEVAVD